MAEIEAGARRALDAIKSAVDDCGGKRDHTLIVLTKHSRMEVEQHVNAFADQLAALMTRK